MLNLRQRQCTLGSFLLTPLGIVVTVTPLMSSIGFIMLRCHYNFYIG